METRDQSNTKVVILAGGLGTRLAEKTEVIPKPIVEIGGRPILWHMKHYAYHSEEGAMETAVQDIQTGESSVSKLAHSYLEYVTQLIQAIDVSALERVVNHLRSVRERGACVYIMRNGGGDVHLILEHAITSCLAQF